MIDPLPQLPPSRVNRARSGDGVDKEIWKPSWNCFCCQDTGRIHPHLVRLVIPEYDCDRDRIPVCQRLKCYEGSKWMHLKDNLDMRLTAAICGELDRISREDWNNTVKQKFLNIQELAKKMAMPNQIYRRTENDEREVQLRKEQVQFELDNFQAKEEGICQEDI
jgi:hypothetical protein